MRPWAPSQHRLPQEHASGSRGLPRSTHGLNFQGRLYLVDHNFAQGETMLNQSVGIREEMVGRVHPEVAGALETDAKLLRHYNRNATAADMETRAKEIRTKLERRRRPRSPIASDESGVSAVPGRS